MNLNQQQTAYLSDTYNRMEQKFRAECHRMNGRIPYISIDGAYPTWDESMINWWTNGFWGGIMWQLYHAENSSDYMSEASCLEEHLEKAFEQKVPVIIDCPVDYRENTKLTEHLKELINSYQAQQPEA